MRLQIAADPKKQQLWACTYVIVCAGEQGENVIQQAKLLEEPEDHTKILGALDEFVSPSTHFVEDSFNYFYLKQGEMSVSHYQAAAEQLIERMVPQYKRLGIDYFKWNQQRYLLIADYYSRFPIIRSVSTMSAAHLVTVLKTIFSEYGLPEELVSDKGTQFTSEQYTSFAEEYNIKITHSSPRYPQ